MFKLEASGKKGVSLTTKRRIMRLLSIVVGFVFLWTLAILPASSPRAQAGSPGAGEVLLYPVPAKHYEPMLHVTGIGRPHQSLLVELNRTVVAKTRPD